MKRRITTIMLVILLISGLGIMAYPWISNGLFAETQAHVIKEYQAQVDGMNEEEIKKAKEKAVGYDEEAIASGVETATNVDDPFTEDQGETAATENEGSYANILQVGETMGYLEIPRIGETLPIYHGTSEISMQEGVGHMEGTSMPVGGESTHCVLASHSGLTSAKLFTDLDKMKVGDKFYLYVLDEKLTYQVDQIQVVLPSDTEKLRIEPGKDYVTLLTCTPIGTNTHRLLVRGTRVPNEEKKTAIKETSNKASNKTIFGWLWWMLPLMVIAFLVFRISMRRKK